MKCWYGIESILKRSGTCGNYLTDLTLRSRLVFNVYGYSHQVQDLSFDSVYVSSILVKGSTPQVPQCRLSRLPTLRSDSGESHGHASAGVER